VKLCLREEGSREADTLWDAADEVLVAEIGYLETTSALAAAWRARRLSSRGLAGAKAELERRWAALVALEVDGVLVREAAGVAEHFGLHASDALHLAGALSFDHPEVALATWDAQLADAARAAGLPVAP
jgi:predicted nucleic acid-binding protein